MPDKIMQGYIAKDGKMVKTGASNKLEDLTFTGAVNGVYNGADPLSVEIPGLTYPEVPMTEPTVTLEPNKYYVWGEMASLDITLAPEKPGVANEYVFSFASGSAPTTLSVPGDIKWQTPLNIEASKKYQVSIMDGLGVWTGA